MNEYEALESKGQTNIFDFLQDEQNQKSMKLDIGDKVMIRFYIDELEYIRKNAPHLLQEGTIVDAKLDFWIVDFGGQEIAVESKKLNKSL